MNGKISEHSVRPYEINDFADRHPGTKHVLQFFTWARLARDRRRAVRAEMRRAEAERRAVVARLRHERTT